MVLMSCILGSLSPNNTALLSNCHRQTLPKQKTTFDTMAVGSEHLVNAECCDVLMEMHCGQHVRNN